MNTLQALAVAAAALAISGDPAGGYLAKAEAQLTAFVTHAELYLGEFAAATPATRMAHEERCNEKLDSDLDQRPSTHGLPDTSIHVASRAARI